MAGETGPEYEGTNEVEFTAFSENPELQEHFARYT